MITLDQLKLGLIRCAECWPEARVLNPNGNCIIAQVVSDMDERFSGPLGQPSFSYLICVDALSVDHAALVLHAITLNDTATSWREIVKQLGLVPGEYPAEPVPQPEPEKELAHV